MNVKMYDYQDLHIWKKGIEIAQEINKIGSLLPGTEWYGLKSQISSASVAISSNIIHGTGRNNKADFNKCLIMALGSAYECETQLLLIQKNQLIKDDKLIEHGIKGLNEIEMMINDMIIDYQCHNRLIRACLNRSKN